MESVSEEFPTEEEVDPAADFLAREQSELAGLEDELQTTSPPLANGNESENTANDIPADVSEFELNVELNGDAIESELSSQSPLSSKTQSSINNTEPSNNITESSIINTATSNNIVATSINNSATSINNTEVSNNNTASYNNNTASYNNNTATSQNITTSQSQYDHIPIVKPPREEPEKIKKWREEQKKSLEEKDIMEDRKKEEWRLNAKKELEDWYKHHEESLTKTRANNRNAEQKFISDSVEKLVPGTQWKRIAKLCDFNKKASFSTKDASRMRSIILQLQQDASRKQV